jgi:hypothetical protein
MSATRVSTTLMAALALLALFAGSGQPARALTIYDIQHVDLGTDPTGTSPYDGSVVDCAGGIVTHIYAGSRPRLMLQDPDYLNGWGAIQVKGWSGDDTFAGVNVGDSISLTNVLVEEHRGTTFLQFGGSLPSGPAPDAQFSVEGTGNSIPAPTVVTLDKIAAPVEGPPGEWYVADHTAELYESMWLTVENVAVTAIDLGKEPDNYNLHNAAGNAWASDYMNVDLDYGELYHDYVHLSSQFVSVTGILEQYQKDDNWDYYQLMTTCTGDFMQVVPEPTACVALLTGIGCLVVWTLVRRRKPQFS